MDANVIVATYGDGATAQAAAQAVAAAGIAREAIQLVARPDEPPAEGDLDVRDRLTALGLPAHDAQIFADLVEGGTVLVAVTASEAGADLQRTLAVLGATPLGEPLATFAVEVDALPR